MSQVMMRNTNLLWLPMIVALAFFGCQTDAALKKQLPGKYRMTLATVESMNDLQEMEKKLERWEKEALRKSISNDDDGSSEEFGDSERRLAKAWIKLRKTLGDSGLKLTEALLQKLALTMDIRPNGSAFIGAGPLKTQYQWTVEGGKLYLWSPRAEKPMQCEGFTIKKVGTKVWDLDGCNLDFHLEPVSSEEE